MSNKAEVKDLDKTYKVYTTLQLKVGKMEQFTPKNLTEIVIVGMRQMQTFKKELRGVQRKEKLISVVKLLIKENGNPADWSDYNPDDLHQMIDSLYEGGILRKGCCFC